ncbi:peroxiredoxin [Dinoroseobacter sp. PD6]|uniref:peroxiredoxin n=1 Tax=Dinoroseobacter sp. PD6 TaxID=3028384 RepID=UPI00237A976E|nr:peroxiredoxin [Dinoroseobacter sp. PD6]MDD9718249.1 peroxiredoxin [Dinoroseobacter sp. PD6]
MTGQHGFEIEWSELPKPVDDGAAAHLPGMVLPAVALPSTGGGTVALDRLPGTAVLYVYPMTGTPGVALPEGWNDIPGARGCTPQSCAFRDHFADLQAAGAAHVFGISTQSPRDQAAAAARLHLPFPLLSDAAGALTRALRLPTFEADGITCLKRLTLIARDGRIATCFYPVFPPDRNAAEVESWLKAAPNR